MVIYKCETKLEEGRGFIMVIYMCDRCGKELVNGEKFNLDLRCNSVPKYLVDDSYEHYDLCEDCAAELTDFINEPKKIRVQTINRLNAFQKAFEEMKGEE